MEDIYDTPKSDKKQSYFNEMPRDLELKEWLFSFKGRLNRKQFWLFYGPYFLTFSLGIFNIKIPLIITVIMLWPLLAVQSKRWHDLGKSGWWSLVWFAPIVGWLLVFLDAGIHRGDKLNNKYGKSLYKNA